MFHTLQRLLEPPPSIFIHNCGAIIMRMSAIDINVHEEERLIYFPVIMACIWRPAQLITIAATFILLRLSSARNWYVSSKPHSMCLHLYILHDRSPLCLNGDDGCLGCICEWRRRSDGERDGVCPCVLSTSDQGWAQTIVLASVCYWLHDSN